MAQLAPMRIPRRAPASASNVPMWEILKSLAQTRLVYWAALVAAAAVVAWVILAFAEQIAGAL
jgi:hypothetical protein